VYRCSNDVTSVSSPAASSSSPTANPSSNPSTSGRVSSPSAETCTKYRLRAFFSQKAGSYTAATSKAGCHNLCDPALAAQQGRCQWAGGSSSDLDESDWVSSLEMSFLWLPTQSWVGFLAGLVCSFMCHERKGVSG
jgi:hypothetical protein